MIDTCQAASMYEKFYSPNILAVASSLIGEDSLSVYVLQLFTIAFHSIQSYNNTVLILLYIHSIMLIRQSVFTLSIDIPIML